MIPALVITGPVAPNARSIHLARAVMAGLFADPAHEEDRVVGPGRDQADERTLPADDRQHRLQQ